MYRIPVLEKFSWQESIISLNDGSAIVATKGNRYIVDGTPAGAFSAASVGQIAWYDGSQWVFDTPAEGWRVFNKDTDTYYWYDGLAWTDAVTIGDITINGDIITPNESDWLLADNQAQALTFTDGYVTFLNFDTIDGQETLSTGVGATFQTNGVLQTVGLLDVDNDINLETRATAVDLMANTVSAVSFDTSSLAGILAIDTTTGAEKVTMSNGLVVHGDLTIEGTTTTINSQTLVVEDKLITLNRGGEAASANGSGIEFEEDGIATGFLKISADRAALEFNAPANDFTLTLDVDATKTIKVTGALDIEDDSIINQDVTTDAKPTFAGVSLDGDITFGEAYDVDIVDGNVSALSFDSATYAGMLEFDTLNGVLKTSVPFSGAAATFSGNITLAEGSVISDDETAGMTLTSGSNSVTVAQAEKAYDSRAQYDAVLGLVVFDVASLDLVV